LYRQRRSRYSGCFLPRRRSFSGSRKMTVRQREVIIECHREWSGSFLHRRLAVRSLPSPLLSLSCPLAYLTPTETPASSLSTRRWMPSRSPRLPSLKHPWRSSQDRQRASCPLFISTPSPSHGLLQIPSLKSASARSPLSVRPHPFRSRPSLARSLPSSLQLLHYVVARLFQQSISPPLFVNPAFFPTTNSPTTDPLPQPCRQPRLRPSNAKGTPSASLSSPPSLPRLPSTGRQAGSPARRPRQSLFVALREAQRSLPIFSSESGSRLSSNRSSGGRGRSKGRI
jgi:hypothetical protein